MRHLLQALAVAKLTSSVRAATPRGLLVATPGVADLLPAPGSRAGGRTGQPAAITTLAESDLEEADRAEKEAKGRLGHEAASSGGGEE